MKKILTLLLTACLGLSLSAQVFTDASAFPVYGKVSDATKTRYQRLPADLEGVSRDAVWHLGTQSAGLYIRFRSNSTAIHARWTSTYGCGVLQASAGLRKRRRLPTAWSKT